MRLLHETPIGILSGTLGLPRGGAAVIVVMLPVSFVLSRLLQALGVWYGFAVTEYIVAVLSYYIYKFHMRDIKG